MSSLVQYVMMQLNNRSRGEMVVTWRDVVMGTPWLDVRAEFSEEQQATFCLQPAPSNPSELEKEIEVWWQVCMLQKKCVAPPASPPNTPATDTEASGSVSTGPGPSILLPIAGSGAGNPVRTHSKPPPGIPVPPSNQFVPTSDWTKLPDCRAGTPATSTKYRTLFDELDVELDRSSVVETPLLCFEMEEAIDSLLRQCTGVNRWTLP